MSDGKGRGLCPRLVDYLCIVGSNKPQHRPYCSQSPELLARYPSTDHKDFPLPRDMVYFCQPEGCIFTSARRPQAKETQSFVFTLTDKDSGITRYGVCLNFYRGVENRGSPRSSADKRESWTRGTDRSTDSAFSSDYRSHSTVGPSDSDREREDQSKQRQSVDRTLTEGMTGGRRADNQQRRRRSRDTGESVVSGAADSDGESPNSSNQRRRRDSGRRTNRRTQCLTSVCIISSHPFFSSFRSCLATLKRLVDACPGSNSRGKDRYGQKGCDLVWSVLTGSGSDAVSSFLLHDIREIETWILRLLSTPIPVPGRTRLELEIIDRRYGPLLIFALPDQTRFSLCDFPLHLPLELLGVETTLQVLTLIMLESKVILISKDFNALSLSVLALTYLLYPLQYMFPVIPLLPTVMPGVEQLLLAPTPYIIGIPASFLPAKKNFSVPEDVWRVDLDSGKVCPPEGQSLEDIPVLPEPEGKTLRSHLKQAVASLSIQPISNLDLMHPDKVAAILRNCRELEDSPTGYNPFIYGNDVDSVDIATRVAMVRFFNSPNVLANFTEHTRTLRLYPRPVVAFQMNSLIKSRPKNSTFITKLCQTQAVEFYAEWVLMPSNLAFQRIHTGLLDPIVIGDKFKWYAHNLEPISFIVWDNLSSLNQALKSLKESETPATDESGSDSECGSSSSSFSSCSDQGLVQSFQEQSLAEKRSYCDQIQTPVSVAVPASVARQTSGGQLRGPPSDNRPRVPPRIRPAQSNPESTTSSLTARDETAAGKYNLIHSTSGYSSPPVDSVYCTPPRLQDRSTHLRGGTEESFPTSRSPRGDVQLQRYSNFPGNHQHISPRSSSTPQYKQTKPNFASQPPNYQETEYPPYCGRRPPYTRQDTPNTRELTNSFYSEQQLPYRRGARLVPRVDQEKIYNPPQQIQVPDNQDNSGSLPPSSEESPSEGESLSPVPPDQTKGSSVNQGAEEVFTSESEHSGATCKTVRNMGAKNFSTSASVSCGSELSLLESEQESSKPSSINKITANFAVKFPRSRVSESSSSSGSRKVSDSRQSSTEDVAQELFNNIEQFTRQAKKAAETLETAGKSAVEASRSAVVASKSAVEASKSRVIAKGYVKKDTIEDLEDVRKNVVDDIKTAIEKKNDILKALGDSSEKKDRAGSHEEEDLAETERTSLELPSYETGEPDSLGKSVDIESDFSRQSSVNTKQSISDDPVFDEVDDSQPFFSHIGTDISGLATQTSDFIGGLFDDGADPIQLNGRGSMSMPGSQSGSPTNTPRTSVSRFNRQSQGPFPRGSRKGLVERNALIRHPSSRSMDGVRLSQSLEQKNAITAENHAFIKDVVEQVLAGDGVGWLKLNRLRKLMEDENYRNIILSKINRTVDRRIGPDNHIDDVCLKRTVYKGILKILLSVIQGLEVTVANFGVGGMASAYQLLEISHTHYWSKDLSESLEYGLHPNSGGNSRALSLSSSPTWGSRENLHKLKVPGSTCSIDNDDSGESRKSSNSENQESSTGELLKELIQQKKQLLFGRITSVDSETESECNNSESGSIITNPAFQRTRGLFSSIRSAVSDTDVESNFPSSRGVSSDLWPSKSSKTSGYRYHGGDIITTMKIPPQDNLRTYIFEGIISKERTCVWDNLQVWEDIFLDSVSQEREAIGMDSGAEVMMERYRGLCESEKKRLEHEEDRLLSTMLFNLTAFMIMMCVNKSDVKKKIRRLLGKSHIGLVHSQEINVLLEKINQLNANDIDLKPLPSRQVNRQSFTVHAGTDANGELLFLEVRDDGMVLRTTNGTIAERWFFERLVNMTYSPKNKVLCLWRRQGGQTQLHKYYTKKCKDLYYSIKGAMERAAAAGSAGVTPGMELGGEFPVQDIQSGEGGLLQVCMEGVGLLFASSKFFVRLDHIRKCFTQKEGIFVLEEFNPKTRKIVQRKYKSSMADQICYAVLCVFSYVAAGQNRNAADKGSRVPKRSSSGHLPSGGVSPRGPLFSDRSHKNV